MFSLKCFQAAAVAIATLGLGFAAPDASAGSCSSRSYSHGSHVSGHYSGGGVHVSFRTGSRHYDHGHHGHYRSSHRSYGHVRSTSHCSTTVTRHVHHRPSGYWTNRYCPPVYETRYYSCGTPYRVCVQSGHYERVWVSYRH